MGMGRDGKGEMGVWGVNEWPFHLPLEKRAEGVSQVCPGKRGATVVLLFVLHVSLGTFGRLLPLPYFPLSPSPSLPGTDRAERGVSGAASAARGKR